MITVYFDPDRFASYRAGYADGEQDRLSSAPRYEDMASDQVDYVEGYDDDYDRLPRATLRRSVGA